MMGEPSVRNDKYIKYNRMRSRATPIFSAMKAQTPNTGLVNMWSFIATYKRMNFRKCSRFSKNNGNT